MPIPHRLLRLNYMAFAVHGIDVVAYEKQREVVISYSHMNIVLAQRAESVAQLHVLVTRYKRGMSDLPFEVEALFRPYYPVISRLGSPLVSLYGFEYGQADTPCFIVTAIDVASRPGGRQHSKFTAAAIRAEAIMRAIDHG